MDLRIFTEPQQGATYDDLLAVARAAEDLGYDAFFRSDHILKMGDVDGGPGPSDSFVSLGAIATQVLVVFLIRTRLRPWRDRVDPLLAATTLGALGVALAIPFSPLGEWFGFRAPSAGQCLALAAVVAAYLTCAELLKGVAMGRPVAVRGRAQG